MATSEHGGTEPEEPQYFFKVNDAERDRRPRGIMRRSEVDGRMHDEVYNFAKDTWVPTGFFRGYLLGHTDWDSLETTVAYAEAFIATTQQVRAERGQ